MLTKYIQYLEAERRYSSLTVHNYKRDIGAFLSWCECGTSEFDLRGVETDNVREWIVFRMESGGIAPSSMNREVSSIRSFFKWLHRCGVVDRDICRGISSLKTPRRLPSFVAESRMETVVERCREVSDDFETERNSLIMLLLYGCGLRLSELISIDMGSFSSDYTSLRVLGKGNKERIVPIVVGVKTQLFCYLEIIRSQNIWKISNKALILNRSGERISRSTVYRIVTSELRRSGVEGKSSPHVLRHTFATHLLNGGADMRDIQELLGHASLQTTQIYTHNSISKLREIYSKAHPRERDE